MRVWLCARFESLRARLELSVDKPRQFPVAGKYPAEYAEELRLGRIEVAERELFAILDDI